MPGLARYVIRIGHLMIDRIMIATFGLVFLALLGSDKMPSPCI